MSTTTSAPSTDMDVNTLDANEVERLLARLRSLPEDASQTQRWNVFPASDWPALFRLVDLAADLPRVAHQRALATWPEDAWPQLTAANRDLERLQQLVDHPEVLDAAELSTTHALDERPTCLELASKELEASHCVTVAGLLDASARGALDIEIDRLMPEKLGSWGQLERDVAPGLYEIFDHALSSDVFRQLSGVDLAAGDTYSLTLSLQNLDATGIGWHRDLYWPREWVGEDVFAVLYGLGDDIPERGGAFVHYVPWENRVLTTWRQRHQATILWNSADASGRLLHAVSGYSGDETSRHLIILQCLRRQR